MYEIEQIDYHYYYEITEHMNARYSGGYEVIQVLKIEASDNNDKMHRATILFKIIT